MRAEDYHRVSITTDDSDFKVKADYAKTVLKSGEKYTGLNGTPSDVFEYVGDEDYVSLEQGVTVSYKVYLNDGSNVKEVDISRVLNNEIYYDYTIVASFKIDYLANGKTTVAEDLTGDGTEDRTQTIYTVSVEGWSDRSEEGTGKYTKTEYVADDKDTLEGILNSLYDSNVVDGDIYELVFYVNGTTVTGVWEKEPEKNIVWNAGNSLDLNGDGKVSCDEYYGTTGLEWSDKLNACVVSSTGDAVVTIPNTATK